MHDSKQKSGARLMTSTVDGSARLLFWFGVVNCAIRSSFWSEMICWISTFDSSTCCCHTVGISNINLLRVQEPACAPIVSTGFYTLNNDAYLSIVIAHYLISRNDRTLRYENKYLFASWKIDAQSEWSRSECIWSGWCDRRMILWDK